MGFLPFFVRNTGPGYRNDDILWPLFGHTERTGAKAYEETRYLWPLLVQGQGNEKTVQRWAPFYTHSINRGYEKTWYLWPLLRNAQWSEAGVTRDRTQLLYFIFWSETQRRVNSNATPAQLTHLWPLLSEWEDGAGRSQWQMPSQLEVFFPGNEKVRQVWSPLFALVRHQQTALGEERTSVLWDALAIIGLFLAGLRFGGRRYGATLAFAWATYPLTLYAFMSNTNDSIAPAVLVWGFLSGHPFQLSWPQIHLSPTMQQLVPGIALIFILSLVLIVPLLTAGRSPHAAPAGQL